MESQTAMLVAPHYLRSEGAKELPPMQLGKLAVSFFWNHKR